MAASQPEVSAAPTRLKFWGVRGSIPTPGPTTVHYGGNTSCVEVRAQGQIIILDAGTGLRPLGRQLTAEFDSRPLELTLLLTHTHWDHIQGLPFFLPVFSPHNQVFLRGAKGTKRGLDNVLTSQMESPFFPSELRKALEAGANLQIEELKDKDLSFGVGAVRVEAFPADHPGACFGYRLFTPGGSIAFFPDNEPGYGHNGPAPRSDDSRAKTSSWGQALQDRMIEFLRGTDVLIMDAQYDQEEYPEHRGWGHGCLDAVVELALRAEAKRLFLFHHDPEHDDAKISQMVAHARKLATADSGTLQAEAARERFSLELKSGGAQPEKQAAGKRVKRET